MHAYLLYRDKEYSTEPGYLTKNDLTTDLNLTVIIKAACSPINGASSGVEDTMIEGEFTKLLMLPLKNKEEVEYRQRVVAQAIDRRENIIELYNMAKSAVDEINRLSASCRKVRDDTTPESGRLMARLLLLKEVYKRLDGLKISLIDIRPNFSDDNGFTDFIDRFIKEYADSYEMQLKKVLENLEFYTTDGMFSISAGIGPGFKLSDMRVEKYAPVTGDGQKTADKDNKWYSRFFSGNGASNMNDEVVAAESDDLKEAVVGAVLDNYDSFVDEQMEFFHNLLKQLAFLCGCCILADRFESYSLITCIPHILADTLEGKIDLSDAENINTNIAKSIDTSNQMYMTGAPAMTDGAPTKIEAIGLYDPTLALRIQKMPIANDIPSTPNNMFIVTGANQGGKSTFLRSIGIAHVMAMCGLFVPATDFSCCLYEQMFTHFAKREDVSMNSGRLEDELKRMSFIIDNITRRSIVLLNESFATTTEKEGSAIARDLAGALYANGMTVFMVTHLLQFANEIYSKRPKRISFYRADRREDGSRTYKILPGRPLDTSFGLDLYDEMLHKYREENHMTLLSSID